MPNDDLISRNDVLEIIMQYCADDDGSCEKPNADLREMLDEVENIPAVDAEPVRYGRWIRQDDTFTRYMCSECESKNHAGHENYCHNCGAKMENPT